MNVTKTCLGHILPLNRKNWEILLFYKSNQITFIVTSPQHKCLGKWNSYERAPDSAKKQQLQFTYGQTVQKNNNNNLHMDRQCKKTTNNLHMDRQCKKAALEHLQCSRQCKKTTTIYIWTVHIYRLYRRQCAKYTYIYSVHIVYYKDTLNYQRTHSIISEGARNTAAILGAILTHYFSCLGIFLTIVDIQ